MCLIIVGKSSKVRSTLLETKGLIDSIYTRNADGVGMMYHDAEHGLVVDKALPNSPEEFADFVKRMPDDDREVAIHARYKTHGEINLVQCHPYNVSDGRLALMHNGVLTQGNDADPSMSDTWHYINNVVRPIVEEFPTIIYNEAWQALIAADIGANNRFVYMDESGYMVVLNRDTGIEHDGMWFSNTYAWSPSILIPSYHKTITQGAYSLNQWWKNNRNSFMGKSTVGGTTLYEDVDESVAEDDGFGLGFVDDDVLTAIDSLDEPWISDLIYDYPYDTIDTLLRFQYFIGTGTRNKSGDLKQQLVKVLEEANVAAAVRIAASNPEIATEVIIHGGIWFYHDPDYGRASVDDDADDEQVEAVDEAEVLNPASLLH